MQDLKAALIQANLFWEDKEKNLQMFDEKINRLNETVDLIILPEMFSTGFSMQPEKFAEEMNGPVMQWMRDKTKTLNTVLTGSIIIKDGGRFFNRLIWMKPDGTYQYYDKSD